MKPAGLTRDEVSALLEARLGRQPQDGLEAAVVLEAWGGVTAERAFEVAESESAATLRGGPRNRPRRERLEARESPTAELVPLLLAILAIAAWTGPLTSELGVETVERALLVALPAALAAQWFLRGRHFAGPRGLGSLSEDAGPLAIGLVVLSCLPLLGVPDVWWLGGLLVAAWVAGTVLSRAGLGLVYAGLVTLASLALAGGLPAAWVLAPTDLVLVGLLVLAVNAAPASREGALSSRRAIAGLLLGAGIGGTLVLDPSIGWGIHGAAPALALLPATVGTFWAGRHLSRVGIVIPAALDGAPLGQSDRGSLASPALLLFFEALARMAAATMVLSAALVTGQAWFGWPTVAPALFWAFAFLSLFAFLVGLLDTFGARAAALGAVAVALVLEIGMAQLHAPAFPGEAALLAGLAGCVPAGAPLVYMLSRPGRMLATVLWIR